MKIQIPTTLALFAVPALLAAPLAHAYVVAASILPGTSQTLYVNPNVSAALPDHLDRLEDAAAKIDLNASAMRFSLVTDDDAVSALGNGESEVDFTSNNTKLCGSLACTTRWNAGGFVTEADVYFDIDYDWTLTDAKADSVAYDATMKRPLLNTAMHEFAHALALKHEADVFQVLGNAWNVVNTNGDVTESVLSADTTKGLVDTYGARVGGLEDLSLYHWEHSGSSGEYSTHARTPILNANGTAKPDVGGTTLPVEPAYEVTAGETILVRQTAENRGKTTQSRVIRWYVSTNELITSADTLVATSNINNLAANLPFTWDRSITLPANLVSGQSYWVGAIIDADGTLAEANEINNAVYIAEIQVQ